MEGVAKGRIGDWGEVVTRYPYENVGMDHLLSMEKEIYERNILRIKMFCLVLKECSLSTSSLKTG